MVGLNVRDSVITRYSKTGTTTNVVLDYKIKNKNFKKMFVLSSDCDMHTLDEFYKGLEKYFNEYADDSIILVWDDNVIEELKKFIPGDKFETLFKDMNIVVLKDRINGKMYIKDNMIYLMGRNGISNLIDLYNKMSNNTLINFSENTIYSIYNKDGTIKERYLDNNDIIDVLVYYGMFEKDFNKLNKEGQIETEFYDIKIEKIKVI